MTLRALPAPPVVLVKFINQGTSHLVIGKSRDGRVQLKGVGASKMSCKTVSDGEGKACDGSTFVFESVYVYAVTSAGLRIHRSLHR